jgi:uncharacterized protein
LKGRSPLPKRGQIELLPTSWLAISKSECFAIEKTGDRHFNNRFNRQQGLNRMILYDASILLCLADRTQPQHHAYKNAVVPLTKPLLTTWPCLTEAMYIALHRGGWMMQNHLGQILLENLLNVYDIQESDYSRLLMLIEQYCDRPMDLADATLVLAAEKTGYRQILTLDSDFLFYRISNQDSFEIILI